MTISALLVDLQQNQAVTKLHKKEVSHESISSLDSAVDAHIEQQFRGFKFSVFRSELFIEFFNTLDQNNS